MNVLVPNPGSGATLRPGVAAQSPPDRSLDSVTTDRVVELTGDELARVFRALRPGGRLDAAVADAEACRDLLVAAGFVDLTMPDPARFTAGKPAAPRGVELRPMRAEDADEVLAIYQAGIDGGQASFETDAPAWEAFDAKRLPLHRYVAVDTGEDRVLGWIAVTGVSARRVYAGVVEHSVYVDPAAQGRGVGTALLAALIGSTEAGGVWTIQSGIFPENTASLRLHARAGFRTVGTRERVGRHHGRWRDVVLLERRSTVAGTA